MCFFLLTFDYFWLCIQNMTGYTKCSFTHTVKYDVMLLESRDDKTLACRDLHESLKNPEGKNTRMSVWAAGLSCFRRYLCGVGCFLYPIRRVVGNSLPSLAAGDIWMCICSVCCRLFLDRLNWWTFMLDFCNVYTISGAALCGLRGNWIDTGSSGWRSSRLFPWQSYMLSVDTSELTSRLPFWTCW